MEYLFFFAGVAVGIVYAEVFLKRKVMPYVWRCAFCAETRFSGNNEDTINQMAQDHLEHFHSEENYDH